jgi:hypothetical protein
MKLTAEQIQIVEDTLNLNGLVYDDIKLEVLDHIASEIENKMSLENRSFEETLKAVFENWKEQLRPTHYGLLLGKMIGPKILMDKMALSVKKELIILSSLVFLLTSFFVFINSVISNQFFLMYVENVTTYLSFIGLVLLIFSKIYLFKSTIKTSYKFRFNNVFFVASIYAISRGLGAFPSISANKIIDGTFPSVFKIIYGMFMLIVVVNSIRFAYLHFQFEKKYAI